MQATDDDRVRLNLGKRRATLAMDGTRVASFDIERTEVLTAGQAERLAAGSPKGRLVVFERSSPQARGVLRSRGFSYAAADGELFIHEPPVHVERPPHRRLVVEQSVPASPFAIRSSRVPRWLLLHADEHPSLRELAETVELSEAMVSRTARALSDDGLAVVEPDPRDGRRRRLRLRDAGSMLDAFERAVAARRPRRMTWDVGARDVSGAIDRLQAAADQIALPYAIGGLAGAAFVRRAVEPAEVDIWIRRDDPAPWIEELMAVPARPGPGRITARLISDPFVLSLATSHDRTPVADPVQLYLDCRQAGERALEAAEAIRSEMSW
jgi:DNA-binding MarR family transcriptional regulator